MSLPSRLFSASSQWLNVLIAFSQLGNALVGGFPDESMSARTPIEGMR